MAGLVIFDCDGVLVDSEPISLRELTRALHRIGLPMDLAEVRATFMGGALETIEREVARRLDRPPPADWLERFFADRAAAFERELRPVPGARAMVEAVQGLGYETCIASQGRPEKMAQTLTLTGLRELFVEERIFSATMVPRPKPAPDLFVHAARTCGWAPDDCVVVEDTVLGVRGARAAGMRVIGYVAPDRPEDEAVALAAAGAELVRSLDEVPARVAA